MKTNWTTRAALLLLTGLATQPILADTVSAPHRIDAKSCDADSVLLYGYNRTSSYMSMSSLDGGVYSFQCGKHNTAQLEADANKVPEGSLCFYAAGKFYNVTSDYNWLTGATTTTLTGYNAQTWEKESEVATSLSLSKQPTYSQSSGKVYTMVYGGSWDPWLCTLDPATGDTTLVAALEASLYYDGFCAGDNGVVYAFNSTTYVMSAINTVTGETQEVGEITSPGTYYTSVFDSKSGRIIYVAGEDSEVKFYAINPNDASQTELGTVPGKMMLAGLYIPDAVAGAPDAVTGLSIAYKETGGTAATVSFNVPTKTCDGQTLAGTLTARVSIDGTLEEQECQPGATVTLDKTLGEGAHVIEVSLRNEAGTSPLRRLNTYAGKDVPGAVENLAFSIGEDGKASLSWTAPSTSQGGGEVDDASLNYRVVREPNSVVVAESLTDTQFEEQLTDAFAHYYYKVTAYSGANAGATATTGEVKWGTVDVPPFLEDFEDWEDFSRFTVVNPLDDGYDGWSNMSGSAYTMPNGQTASDYYLFSPAVRLKKGETYTLSFNTSVSSYKDEEAKLIVTLAPEKITDASRHTVLLDTMTLSGSAKTAHYKDMKVEADGEYYLCFHAVSDISAGQMALDDVKMVVSSLASAPDSVGALTVTPGEKGALTAKVAFTTPDKAADGGSIGALTSVSVYRGAESDVPAYSWTAPEKGQQLEWTDTEAAEGINTYRVVAHSAEGKGMDAHGEAYVGFDSPLAVTALKASAKADDPTVAVLSWDAAAIKGRHGGYVDPAEVTYTIERLDDVDAYYRNSVATNLTTTTYTDDSFAMPEGKRQNIVKYYVTAANVMGTSPEVSVLLTLGQPYDLPYAESFAESGYSSAPWTPVTEQGKASWATNNGVLTDVKPYDGDHGMLQFANKGVGAAEGTLQSPRISLQGAADATLSFYLYHGALAEEGDLTLSVLVSKDDAAPVELATIDYNNGDEGWTRHNISLGDVSTAANAVVYLKGYALDASAALFLDKLEVYKTQASDLALSNLSMPEKAQPGQSAEAVVEVSNVGKNDFGAYTVNLYKADELVATAEGQALAAGTNAKLVLPVSINMADAYKTTAYRAALIATGDDNDTNNSSQTVAVYVVGNTLPTPHLAGDAENGKIVLYWDAPNEEAPVEKLESFENCIPYALDDFEGWTTHDGDGAQTYYSKYWTKVTNAKAPMAWEVWDYSIVTDDGFNPMGDAEAFAPHAGEKCLISFSAIEESWFGDYSVANDNWAISPKVVEGTDVTFWMKSLQSANNEYFEVLVSYDDELDDSPADDFEVLCRDSLTTQDWQKFSVTLPLGATHFAIRGCTPTNGYVVLLDDVTFTPAEGAVKEVTLVGYNVYRDGVLVASGLDDNTYTEESDQQAHTYNVTAVWTDGESTFSNDYLVSTETGIGTASAPTGTDVVAVYTTGGVQVAKSARNLPIGVYLMKTADGKVVKVAK